MNSLIVGRRDETGARVERKKNRLLLRRGMGKKIEGKGGGEDFPSLGSVFI